MPAQLTRKIFEAELINAYHWLPKDIAEIPYKKLKDLILILEQKEETRERKRAIENKKAELNSFTSGKGRRTMYREI